MIRDLNEENQDLTDRLASEQQARLQASETAAAAARQVDALKMALDIQQRKSGAYSDMLAMQGFFDHSVQSVSSDTPSIAASHLPPSLPRSPPLGDMQHVPRMSLGVKGDECRDKRTEVLVGAGMEAGKVMGADGTGGAKCSITVACTEEIRREEKRVDEARRELGEGTVHVRREREAKREEDR